MAAKNSHRAKSRSRSIESLEDRRVMAADPLSQLLGGAIQQHYVDETPALVQHDQSQPDFWIEPGAERDFDALAGDLEQMIANGDAFTGLSQVRSDYGFIGTGQTVAIIDSGIAWDHVALGSGLGSNYRVVGGWDFSEENDANPYDDGSAGSHGTHVSGIVGGDRTGTVNDGVAPGVDFVGLRVFNDAGEGYFDWVESALQWVHQNRNTFANPITAVNLSLGTTWNDITVPSWTTLEDEFAQLKADGIFVAVSAGNAFTSYNSPGLSYPAASPYVVPVMSVDDNGSLSSFSQRQSRAIAAPGRNIISSVPDYAGNNNNYADDYASKSGTSMAAPYIAGASVLVREAMQFVGYTNITQDTIYDHMMSTATSVFDSITNQNYKRLSLANAIDSLMPTDDFGSTIATAQNLGQLSGTSQLQGLIGKVSDADYFQFTAAGNGTVSFTVTTHDYLAAVWNASGGSVSGANGETYTFQVVAGQSYTLGLSTSNGIGHYDVAINADDPGTPDPPPPPDPPTPPTPPDPPTPPTPPDYTDWGTITQLQSNNVANAGATWYRIQSSQAGYFTAEALFAAGGGIVDISLHDSNRQLLTSGVAMSTGERADLWVAANTEYFLHVVGTNADIDFQLTNLVSQVGATVSVAGTSGADTYTFTIGLKQHSLSINGTMYGFTNIAATTFNFNGGGGNDSITLTGSKKKESATLQVGYTSVIGTGVSATAAAIENVTLNSGGGKDAVWLYDSAGNDLYQAYTDHVSMSGSGYSHTVYGYKNASAYASAGNDTAHLYDSAKNDKYRAYVDHVEMTGSGYLKMAAGFDNTTGHASTGKDSAYLYDSSGNDVYTAYVRYSVMAGAGYSNTASGFATTFAYASLGTDTAHMYDSAGDDLYRTYSNRVIMSGAGYSNSAYGFDDCYGYSSTGNDKTRMYDWDGNDEYRADAVQAQMSGDGFFNAATGFKSVQANASRGVDRAWVDRSLLTNSLAGRAWDDYPAMTAVKKSARGFDEINLSSLATDAESVSVQALDHLFDLLSELR